MDFFYQRYLIMEIFFTALSTLMTLIWMDMVLFQGHLTAEDELSYLFMELQLNHLVIE